MSSPSVRHSTRAVLLALAVIGAAVLGGCGRSGSDASNAPPSSAVTSAVTPSALPTATRAASPDDGRCYSLTYQDAVSDSSDDADQSCRGAHTAETFTVGHLDTLVHGHLLAVDSDQVHDEVATTCPTKLPGFVGGTEEETRLSMVTAVWFTPSVSASETGADWYRCDAVVLAGSESLDSVRGSLKGALDSSAGRERYAMCGTAEPGDVDFSRVLCSDPKATWKAISVVDFEATKYPGVDQAKAAGQTTCKDAGRDASSDPLNYKWAYEYPTATDWSAGQTYGRCWAPV